MAGTQGWCVGVMITANWNDSGAGGDPSAAWQSGGGPARRQQNSGVILQGTCRRSVLHHCSPTLPRHSTGYTLSWPLSHLCSGPATACPMRGGSALTRPSGGPRCHLPGFAAPAWPALPARPPCGHSPRDPHRFGTHWAPAAERTNNGVLSRWEWEGALAGHLCESVVGVLNKHKHTRNQPPGPI